MSQIKLVKFITPEMVTNNPNVLFLFGDNMQRYGKGGQAVYGRNQPNAVGVPTKWRPSRDELAYFKDADWIKVSATIDRDLDRIEDHLRRGGIAVFPEDGIGTGLADLPRRAPKIFRHINSRLEAMGKKYGHRRNSEQGDQGEDGVDLTFGLMLEGLASKRQWKKPAEKIVDSIFKFLLGKKIGQLTLVGVRAEEKYVKEVAKLFREKGYTVKVKYDTGYWEVLGASPFTIVVIDNENEILDFQKIPLIANIFYQQDYSDTDRAFAIFSNTGISFDPDDIFSTGLTFEDKDFRNIPSKLEDSEPSFEAPEPPSKVEKKSEGERSLIEQEFPSFLEFFDWNKLKSLEKNTKNLKQVFGLSGTIRKNLTKDQIKKAIQKGTLQKTKVPNLPENIRPYLKRFPSFSHNKTSDQEIKEMAAAVYGMNEREAEENMDVLRGYMLRFFPSPTKLQRIVEQYDYLSQGDALGFTNIALFGGNKDRLNEYKGRNNALESDLEDLYTLVDIYTPTSEIDTPVQRKAKPSFAPDEGMTPKQAREAEAEYKRKGSLRDMPSFAEEKIEEKVDLSDLVTPTNIDLDALLEIREDHDCDKSQLQNGVGRVGEVASLYYAGPPYIEPSDVVNELGYYLRNVLGIHELIVSAEEDTADVAVEILSKAEKKSEKRSEVARNFRMGVHLLSHELMDGDEVSIEDYKQELDEDRRSFIENDGEEEYIFEDEEEMIIGMVNSSDLCIGVVRGRNTSLRKTIQNGLGADSSDMETFLFYAAVCGREVLLINEDLGLVEYFNGPSDSYYVFTDAKFLGEESLGEGLVLVGEALKAIRASNREVEPEVGQRTVVSDRKVRMEVVEESPYVDSQDTTDLRTLAREAKKERRSKKLQKGLTPTTYKVQTPSQFDPFLRTDGFDRRLVVLPVWSYKDISPYISSYLKNLSNAKFRVLVRQFLRSWADNTGVYLSRDYGNIIDYAEDMDQEQPLISFVLREDFSLEDYQMLVNGLADLNSPLQSTSEDNKEIINIFDDEGDVFGNLGNMLLYKSFDAGDEGIANVLSPFHEFGSALLLQDAFSGDQNADVGLNVLFVYLGDVEGDISVEYFNEYDENGEEFEWVGKIRTTKSLNDDLLDEERAEAAERVLSESINRAIEMLQSYYESIDSDDDFKVYIPEDALFPREADMGETALFDEFGFEDENPILVKLNQLDIPWETLNKEAFSYDLKIGDKPVVIERSDTLFRGLQADSGIGANLYLISDAKTKEAQNNLKAIVKDVGNNISDISTELYRVKDPLFSAIYNGADELREDTIAFVQPVYAVKASESFLNAQSLQADDEEDRGRISFSVVDYLKDPVKFKRCIVQVRGKEKRVLTKEYLKVLLDSKDFPFEVGLGSSEPKTKRIQSGEIKADMVLGSLELTSKDKGAETVEVGGTDVTIKIPNLTEEVWKKRLFTWKNSLVTRMTYYDNNPLNSIRSFLLREITTSKDGGSMRSYETKLRRFPDMGSPYDKKKPPSILEAPIIPAVQYKTEYMGNKDLASQYVYEALEDQLQNFTIIDDEYRSFPVMVFDYNDFAKYKYYRRVTREGKISEFQGIDCLLAVIRIFLQYRGIKSVIYNVPEDLFGGATAKQKEDLSNQAVQFSQRQLASQVKRVAAPEYSVDDNIACIFGVIGSGKAGCSTFVVGDFPKYSDNLESIAGEFDLDEADIKSMDPINSLFKEYFYIKDENNDIIQRPLMLYKGSRVLGARDKPINNNNVLGDIPANMDAYNFIENSVLNNLGILKALRIYDVDKGRLKEVTFGKDKPHPFQATKAEWDAFNERFKAYRQTMEYRKARDKVVREEYEEGSLESEKDISLFDGWAIGYVNDYGRILQQFKKLSEDSDEPVLSADYVYNVLMFLKTFLSPPKINSQTLKYEGYGYLTYLMNKIDSQIITADAGETDVDLIPLKLQTSYLDKKTALFESIKNTSESLLAYRNLLEQYNLLDAVLASQLYAKEAEAEVIEDKKLLDDKTDDFIEMLDASLERATENQAIPTPPPGREPRLSLFAITEDGTCFKIVKTRGKLKRVNEYPFYIANDEFNPMNIQLGALLEPARSGVMLLDIGFNRFGNTPALIAASQESSMKKKEEAAARYLSKVLKGRGKTAAANLMLKGDRGQRISTALNHFGNRFMRIFPEQEKDFFKNTPSLQRYIDTLLQRKMTRVKKGKPHNVVVEKVEGFYPDIYILDPDVQDWREIKEYYDLLKAGAKLDYRYRISRSVSNGFQTIPTQGAGLIYFEGGEREILPLREYELLQYDNAKFYEDTIKRWLKDFLQEDFSQFEKCIVLPGLRGINKVARSGREVLARVNEVIEARIARREADVARSIAAKETGFEKFTPENEAYYCAMTKAGNRFYSPWGNDNKTTGNLFWDFRIRMSALDFYFRRGNTKEGLDILINNKDESTIEKQKLFVPNFAEFRQDLIKSTPDTEAGRIESRGIVELFKRMDSFTDMIIIEQTSRTWDADYIPYIRTDKTGREKMYQALDEILYGIALGSTGSRKKELRMVMPLSGDDQTLGLMGELRYPLRDVNGEAFAMLDYINDGLAFPKVSSRSDNKLIEEVMKNIQLTNELLARLIKRVARVYRQTVCANIEE